MSPNLSSRNSVLEKSTKITRKNSKFKIPNLLKTRNILHNSKNRDTSEPCSYTRLNTSLFKTNNIITKDNKVNKSPDIIIKRGTNFSLVSYRNSISNTTSTNYSSKLTKNPCKIIKKEVKIPVGFIKSSYLNDKLKGKERKSKLPSTEKINLESAFQEVKVYQGPFDLSCVIDKSPKEIRESLLIALNHLKIKYSLKVNA